MEKMKTAKTSFKSKEILLEWFKTPFDEEDAKILAHSEEPVRSLTEMEIIWGMFKAAELLDTYYSDTCTETLSKILQGIPDPEIAQGIEKFYGRSRKPTRYDLDAIENDEDLL